MAQEEPNLLAEWLMIAREGIPVLRHRLVEWFAEVREEPALIWQTVAVRYTAYAICALLLVSGGRTAAGMLVPPLPAEARPTATSGDYHVVCADTSCGNHYVIHREFGFRKFPVKCPKCKRTSGMQARRCNSVTCRGRWVAPLKGKNAVECPRCGTEFD